MSPDVDWARCRAVIFDMDGTLYDQRQLRRRIVPRLLLGSLSAGPGLLRIVSVLRREREALAKAEHADFEPELLRRVAARCHTSESRVATVMAEWLERRPLPLLGACAVPGVQALFAALNAMGRRIAVVSDYRPEAKLQALGLQAHVAIAAADPDVGVQKPHPAGFEKALRLLDACNAEALVVGDRADRDGVAAQRAGIPVLLRGQDFRRFDEPIFAPILEASA